MAVQIIGNTSLGTWALAPGDLTVVLTASVSRKADKKEIKGSSGDVETVVYYNKREECSMEGYGTSGLSAGGTGSVAGVSCHIEEVSSISSNEDFVKSSVKGTRYLAIN